MIIPDPIGSSGHAVVATVMALGGLEWISSFFRGKKSSFVGDGADDSTGEAGDDPTRIPTEEREDDAIYQRSSFRGERLVGRVVDPEIDVDNGRIRFVEISHSDYLLIPDECEFRDYRIQIAKIDDAVKNDQLAEHKGRILYGVTADIVGTREH